VHDVGCAVAVRLLSKPTVDAGQTFKLGFLVSIAARFCPSFKLTGPLAVFVPAPSFATPYVTHECILGRGMQSDAIPLSKGATKNLRNFKRE
jgi:hypothetical protein